MENNIREFEDELDKEVFTCMVCNKECHVTEGSWPQYIMGTDEWNLDADQNTRSYFEFVCYDCIDKD